ncbi:MAG: hypothetical protein NWE96_02405 [Candidatus Bathyarchaeota archaeon]|nr:hypothetical protein [Candidatus Bathyarchaeota archaeon]
MVSKKSREHRSKTLNKSDSLPSLQKAIVTYMAENEPKTIRQISIALSKDYSATHTAFKSLENKKLVAKVTVKRYREQDFGCYWLTDEGTIMALMEGANADKLLQQTKNLYPEAEITHCFLQVIPLFDPVMMRTAYSYVKGKGTLGFAEVAQIILSGTAEAMDIETGKKVSTILRRYPKYYAQLKVIVQEMIKTLNQLIEE